MWIFKVPASPGLGFPVPEAPYLALAWLLTGPLHHLILFYFIFYPPFYLVRSENPSLCSVPAVLSLFFFCPLFKSQVGFIGVQDVLEVI